MSLKKTKTVINCVKISLNLAFLAFLLSYIVGLGRVNAQISEKDHSTSAKMAINTDHPIRNNIKLNLAKGVLRSGTPDKVVKAVITAYTSTPDQTDGDPFTAASGKRVYDGMVAANWLPFGTKIKIPALYGDKVFTVDDRMNPRYGYGRMDIWLNAKKAEARKFGVKRVQVEVYYPEEKLARSK